MNKLKEECSRLRYEKMAVETAMQKLIEENKQKDELIRNLKSQLGINNANLRHTVMPHY